MRLKRQSYKSPDETVAEFLTRHIEHRDDHVETRVLGCMHGYSSAYLAVEILRKHLPEPARPPREVIGVICELRHLKSRPGAGQPNFEWSLTDERTNPELAKAPRAILDLLTPTTNPQANAWRNRCWARVHEIERSHKPLGPGDVVMLPAPATFTDGVARSAFVVTHNDLTLWKRLTGLSLEDGAEVSLTRLKRSLVTVDVGADLTNAPAGPLFMRSVDLPDGRAIHLAVSYPMHRRDDQRGVQVHAVSSDAAHIVRQVNQHNFEYQQSLMSYGNGPNR